jgi:hypothetical protein
MKFLIGEIIRNKRTNKPYLILNIIYQRLFVSELEDKNNPTPILVILERDIKNYEKDIDLECETKWLYNEKENEDIIINSFSKAKQVTMK